MIQRRRFILCACQRAAFASGLCPVCEYLQRGHVSPTDDYTPRREA